MPGPSEGPSYSGTLSEPVLMPMASGLPFAGQTGIHTILSTASGSVSTATQLFATANYRRNGVIIVNCDTTDALYVGFTSDVSASKYYAKLAAGASLTIMCVPTVAVYLFSTGTADYLAHEVLFVLT